MLALLKPNQYSRTMRYVDVTADQWRRRIEAPLVMPAKDDAPLIIWGNMTPTVEVDPETRQPRCIGDNIEKLYALQIDIDSGTTIDNFVKDFSRYSFQLYTSFSYGFKEGDRFRVIFPLKEPLYTKHLVPPVKEILRDLFHEADSTCFDKGHWQIVPCIRSKDAPYRYIRHDGERLSFATDNFAKVAEEYKDEAHWRREIAEADRDPNANHQHALDYVQKIFDATLEGARDKTVYAKIRWLRDDVGCTYSEAISLRPPAGFDEEYRLKVNKLYGCR